MDATETYFLRSDERIDIRQSYLRLDYFFSSLSPEEERELISNAFTETNETPN